MLLIKTVCGRYEYLGENAESVQNSEIRRSNRKTCLKHGRKEFHVITANALKTEHSKNGKVETSWVHLQASKLPGLNERSLTSAYD
jgi:hypothetical protein